MANHNAKCTLFRAQPDRFCSPLSAVQHIRRMNGGTQSHLLRASDGMLYVTKFQNNPRHACILASEFLATKIGLWLGLPMPRVEVIDIAEWLSIARWNFTGWFDAAAIRYGLGIGFSGLAIA